MRYLIVQHGPDEVPDEDGEDPIFLSEVHGVIPCETQADVWSALRATKTDWAIFEIVGGKAERRSIRLDTGVIS